MTQGVRIAKSSRNIAHDEWTNRQEWRLGVAQHRKTFLTDLYIHTTHTHTHIILSYFWNKNVVVFKKT